MQEQLTVRRFDVSLAEAVNSWFGAQIDPVVETLQSWEDNGIS